MIPIWNRAVFFGITFSTEWAFTCLESARETLEKGLKFAQIVPELGVKLALTGKSDGNLLGHAAQ